MESDMDIVIDTSALIAVIVEEPDRTKIIELTTGNTLNRAWFNPMGNPQCVLGNV
jgi:uncharacterized protein with PIN domain